MIVKAEGVERVYPASPPLSSDLILKVGGLI